MHGEAVPLFQEPNELESSINILPPQRGSVHTKESQCLFTFRQEPCSPQHNVHFVCCFRFCFFLVLSCRATVE